MNERIKELLKQSGAYDHYQIMEGLRSDEKPIEKFAELIVKECIDYCGENLSKTVAGVLKIHLGVE